MTLALRLHGPPSKRCPRCSGVLELEAFGSDPMAYLGLSSWCKEWADANREWRAANPDQVEAYNASRRVAPSALTCSECGAEFTGRKGRLTCSRRCRDKRYQRLHPEAYHEKRRRKDARRRKRLGRQSSV